MCQLNQFIANFIDILIKPSESVNWARTLCYRELFFDFNAVFAK